MSPESSNEIPDIIQPTDEEIARGANPRAAEHARRAATVKQLLRDEELRQKELKNKQ